MRGIRHRQELFSGSRRSAHHRFTLIELLIMIAIIAIPAAMLLPALRSARETAKKAGCINNEKNLSLCIHQYAENGRA